MPNYRAYLLNPDNSIKRVEIILGEDDETAVGEAKKLAGGHDIELWHRSRKVATVTKDNGPGLFGFGGKRQSRRHRDAGPAG
jgi:hypothetical protein